MYDTNQVSVHDLRTENCRARWGELKEGEGCSMLTDLGDSVLRKCRFFPNAPVDLTIVPISFFLLDKSILK